MLLDFIENYHKLKMTSLKTSIEQENWQPADIPYSYLTCLNLFFDPSHEMQTSTGAETEAAEELLKSSRPSYRNMLTPQLNDLDQTHDSGEEDTDSPSKPFRDEESKGGDKHKKGDGDQGLVKIMKNELYIEQKKYRLTSSALLLVRIIYDYLHLGQKFKGVSMECVLKVIEIIKVTSSLLKL